MLRLIVEEANTSSLDSTFSFQEAAEVFRANSYVFVFPTVASGQFLRRLSHAQRQLRLLGFADSKRPSRRFPRSPKYRRHQGYVRHSLRDHPCMLWLHQHRRWFLSRQLPSRETPCMSGKTAINAAIRQVSKYAGVSTLERSKPFSWWKANKAHRQASRGTGYSGGRSRRGTFRERTPGRRYAERGYPSSSTARPPRNVGSRRRTSDVPYGP
ncbi:hypothetical protein BJ546DRAFT_988689 [Cryomyces antarcticus]